MPRLIEPVLQEDEQVVELSLWPNTFNEFVGQQRVKEQLSIFLKAARDRGAGPRAAVRPARFGQNYAVAPDCKGNGYTGASDYGPRA